MSSFKWNLKDSKVRIALLYIPPLPILKFLPPKFKLNYLELFLRVKSKT